MKLGLSLGKKKQDSVQAPIDPKPVKAKKAKRPPTGLNGALSGVIISSLIGVMTMAASVYQWVLMDAQKNTREWAGKQVQEVVLQQVNQRIKKIEAHVSSLAAEPGLQALLSTSRSRTDDLGNLDLLTHVPGVLHIHLLAKGQAARVDSASLGFANIDLVRRVEDAAPYSVEAFSKDKKWYVQYAQTVPAGAEGDAIQGVLLTIFDMSVVADALPKSGGKYALAQKINEQHSVIAGQANFGNIMRTHVPNWQLVATAGDLPASLMAMNLFWLLCGGIGVLFMSVSAVIIVRQNQRLQKEAIVVVGFIQQLIKGEKRQIPKLHVSLYHTMVQSIQRSLQALLDSRKVPVKSVAPATEKTSPKAVSKTAKVAPETGSIEEEPLFQSGDSLDIDMMADDEDLLGLGADAEGDVLADLAGSELLDDALPDLGESMLDEVALPDEDVPAGIFRAYDIRGIVGESLTPGIVEQIGRSLGSEALSRGQSRLCVGYDGRLSSPDFCESLVRGILMTGCHVIKIGQVPTPVLYFATHHLETGSGVMITGSHNPANYNGFKVMLAGETLANESIQKLYTRIQHQDFAKGQGQLSDEDVRQAYLDTILGDIAVAAPLRVVVDAGNGVAGDWGPALIEELGCEVIPLYCDVDGRFPNHHPDPGKPENLATLIETVQSEGADLGIAFDGDGDRIGVVTNTGKIIWPDRLLMLFAKDVISRNPGADVLFDVKCSRRLNPLISSYGGRPVMWKTGHSLMKAKMKETGALLAGEMSGHIFFKERWYGFDDGLYSAARLLEVLGIDERSSDDVFAAFPEDISTPEINVPVEESVKFELVESLSKQGSFGDGSVSTIDGIRVDYEDGWGLCRASNTTPVLVLRFEADNDAALERIKQIFKEQLRMIAPELDLSF